MVLWLGGTVVPFLFLNMIGATVRAGMVPKHDNAPTCGYWFSTPLPSSNRGPRGGMTVSVNSSQFVDYLKVQSSLYLSPSPIHGTIVRASLRIARRLFNKCHCQACWMNGIYNMGRNDDGSQAKKFMHISLAAPTSNFPPRKPAVLLRNGSLHFDIISRHNPMCPRPTSMVPLGQLLNECPSRICSMDRRRIYL